VATTRIFKTSFVIAKLNQAPVSGGLAAYKYRRDVRHALVSAANDQGVLAVLNANIPLAGGEVIEILFSKEISEGTEPAVLV